MSGRELITPQWDTPSDSQCSISLDIGIVEKGYPHAGQWIITIQAWPIPTQREANQIAAAMREAIGSRLAIKFDAQDLN